MLNGGGDTGPQGLPAASGVFTWDLDGVGAIQRTLAIPLVGRARAQELFPGMGFADPEAERMVRSLRLTGVGELASHRNTIRGSIVRTQVFDDLTREFLAAHPGATVLNLGAGLCTRRARAGAGPGVCGRWIEADVGEVIAAKAQLAPPPAGTERVAVDLADSAAVERLLRDATAGGAPVLVVSEGVHMFLEPDAHHRLLAALERGLPAGSQIAFDYIHPTVRRLARLHPSLRVTGASYRSDLRPARDLAAYPRLRPLALRLFTDRYRPLLRAADRALGLLLAGGSALYDVALLEVADRPREPARRHGAVAATTIALFVAAAAGSVLLGSPLAYVPLQLACGLVMLRAFCLVHELGHGNLVASRRGNDVWGILASLVCALPYYPWKRVHVEHHKWAGHVAKDPTESDIEFDDLKPVEQKLGSLAWRLWLPLLGMSFSIRTFWNLPRLFKLFPGRRDRRAFVASVLLIPAVHGLLWWLFRGAYLAAYLPAFAVFVFLLDPLMISQHVGIPLPPAPPEGDWGPRPIAPREQEALARTLVFPRWFARHVLLGFNYHSLHHTRPTLPGHLLDSVPFEASHTESWWTWLRRAKRTPLGTLLSRSS